MRLQRVRYCLDSGDRNAATIRRQTQSWTTRHAAADPVDGQLPGGGMGSTGWSPRTSRTGLAPRSVPCSRTGGRPADEIQSVVISLYLDLDPSQEPSEATAETGAFLRNQNRAPIARFTATPAGVGHILLNASESVDPESQPLDVRWYDGGTYMGSGSIYDYNAKTRGVHEISVEVQDVSGLVGRSGPSAVVVP